MQRLGLVLEHLVFHPREGGFGAGLVEQYHQHHPFEIVVVDLVLGEQESETYMDAPADARSWW